MRYDKYKGDFFLKDTLSSSREDFLLPLTPRSVPFGTPRFNSNNNLNN